MNNNKELALATQNELAVASAVAAVTAEIKSCLQLAQMFKRDVDDSRIAILNTCKRPGFAPHVCYVKPIGKTRISGISIRGAEVAANYWKNIKTMVGVIYDDENKRIMNVCGMDLETNTSYSEQFTVEKIIERKFLKQGQEMAYDRLNSYGDKVYGIRPTTDEFDVKVAAQISKKLRNIILRLIPEDIKEEMIEVSNKAMTDQAAKDPKGESKKIADAFSQFNINPSDLKSYLGHDLSKCSPGELAELRTIHKTIKDGQAKWTDYLPVEQPEDPELNTGKNWETDETPDPEEEKKRKEAAKSAKKRAETKKPEKREELKKEEEIPSEDKKQDKEEPGEGEQKENEKKQDKEKETPQEKTAPGETEQAKDPAKPKRPKKEALIATIEEQLEEIPPGLIRREVERHCFIQEKCLDLPSLWQSFKVEILEGISEELERRI